MKIYLAGPLFTAAEREFNARLARALRRLRHTVWLPQEQEQRKKSARTIFREDVEAIDWAEAVVANMDGPDPDSGTCWECGYAYGKKPILLFRTDFRAGAEQPDAPYNLMLTESATRRVELPFTDTATLARRVDRELRMLARRSPASRRSRSTAGAMPARRKARRTKTGSSVRNK
ncbi:MAG: nucleoside 2-deoxyribosyltransferase [Stellaceae bacterium]